MSEPETPRSGKKKKRLSLAVDPADISSFPWSIIEAICAFLSEKDVSRLARVCRKFRSLVTQESLWKKFFDRRYHFLEKKEVLLEQFYPALRDPNSTVPRPSKYREAIRLRYRKRFLFVASAVDGASDTYSTIFDAMMASEDGDVIFITSGVYDEPININKSVEVVGIGLVVISPIGYHCDRPLMIGANGARVVNIRFQPLLPAKITLAGIAEVAYCDIRQCLIWISPTSNAILRRCTISGAQDVAITADGAHSLLEYNQIYDCRGGVSVWSDDFSYGADISLTGNQIYQNKGTGVTLRGARVHAQLVGNNIYQNEEGGVKLLESARLTWTRNNVHDNNGPGIVREGVIEREEYNVLEANRSTSFLVVVYQVLGLDNLSTSTWFIVLMAVAFIFQLIWKSFLQPLFDFSQFR